MAAHRMAEDATPVGCHREVLLDQRRQLRRHIAGHAVVPGPGFSRRIQIETGAGAEIPIIVLAGQAEPARTGIGRHQDQPQLGGEPERAGLDHEGLVVAGQPGQVVERRQCLRLGGLRHEHREIHRGSGLGRGVRVKSDPAAETEMFAARGEHEAACKVNVPKPMSGRDSIHGRFVNALPSDHGNAQGERGNAARIAAKCLSRSKRAVPVVQPSRTITALRNGKMATNSPLWPSAA